MEVLFLASRSPQPSSPIGEVSGRIRPLPDADTFYFPRFRLCAILEMLRNYLWRQRIKFGATFGFSMMEPWEKILTSKYSFCALHVPFLARADCPRTRHLT